MSRTVAIIQARMGSTRLPGKVLMDLSGKTMLERVIQRAQGASCLDMVVVATTALVEDDAIAALCDGLKVLCYRHGGEPGDVLSRVFACAELYGASTVVRLTADCPLVNPLVIDRSIRLFRLEGLDYLRYMPDGFDHEVMGFGVLREACRLAEDRYDREHVTPFISRHPELFCQMAIGQVGVHLSVDTAEDLELLRKLYHELGWVGLC